MPIQLFKTLALSVVITSAMGQTSPVYAPKEVPKPMEMKPEMTEFWEPAVPVITPGKTVSDAPSDAKVLFDGKNLNSWKSDKTGGAAEWTVKDGYFEVAADKGDIKTKDLFTDCQLHIEWSAPIEIKGVSQGRGNSGVFFQEKYEVQVLDNYENRTYANGQAGSLYKDTPPLVNPIKKPGDWNVYDIIYRAPRFKANGKLDAPATVTVLFNGVLVQNNTTLLGLTQYIGVHQYPAAHGAGAIKLQDHGNPVRFRNVWIREL
jgi:hypothetical protein